MVNIELLVTMVHGQWYLKVVIQLVATLLTITIILILMFQLINDSYTGISLDTRSYANLVGLLLSPVQQDDLSLGEQTVVEVGK